MPAVIVDVKWKKGACRLLSPAGPDKVDFNSSYWDTTNCKWVRDENSSFKSAMFWRTWESCCLQRCCVDSQKPLQQGLSITDTSRLHKPVYMRTWVKMCFQDRAKQQAWPQSQNHPSSQIAMDSPASSPDISQFWHTIFSKSMKIHDFLDGRHFPVKGWHFPVNPRHFYNKPPVFPGQPPAFPGQGFSLILAFFPEAAVHSVQASCVTRRAVLFSYPLKSGHGAPTFTHGSCWIGLWGIKSSQNGWTVCMVPFHPQSIFTWQIEFYKIAYCDLPHAMWQGHHCWRPVPSAKAPLGCKDPLTFASLGQNGKVGLNDPSKILSCRNSSRLASSACFQSQTGALSGYRDVSK